MSELFDAFDSPYLLSQVIMRHDALHDFVGLLQFSRESLNFRYSMLQRIGELSLFVWSDVHPDCLVFLRDSQQRMKDWCSAGADAFFRSW